MPSPQAALNLFTALFFASLCVSTASGAVIGYGMATANRGDAGAAKKVVIFYISGSIGIAMAVVVALLFACAARGRVDVLERRMMQLIEMLPVHGPTRRTAARHYNRHRRRQGGRVAVPVVAALVTPDAATSTHHVDFGLMAQTGRRGVAGRSRAYTALQRKVSWTSSEDEDEEMEREAATAPQERSPRFSFRTGMRALRLSPLVAARLNSPPRPIGTRYTLSPLTLPIGLRLAPSG
jgi:hypothetical protein